MQKKVIAGIDLQKLRQGEYAQLMQDILSIIRKINPVAMQVETPFNQLQTVVAEIEILFKQPIGSTITAELKNFDLLRDNALKGITNLIAGYMYSQDVVVKNHATVLSKHLALYGKNIVKDSYQSENNALRNIIEDWNTQPKLTAAINALNLQSWQTDLENANNSFADKYLQRAVQSGTTETPEPLKAKRLRANTAYYDLRENLIARYIITNGAEPYKTVVASINGLIIFYNELLSRRGGGDEEAPVVDPVPGG